MALGPVEMIVLSFPTDRPGPEVAAAVRDVIAQGAVRIVDLLFIARSEDGEARVIELSESDATSGWAALDVEVLDLVNDEDIDDLAAVLDPGQSAAVLVIEHIWARELADAVRNAGAQVELQIRIPREDVEAAEAAVAAGT